MAKEMELIDLRETTYIREVLVEKQFDFGEFFFFEGFIVSQINEGVSYDWSKAWQVIQEAEEFYGADKKLHYISNRLHDYSVVPTDWLKFTEARKHIKTYITVTSSQRGRLNVIFEKMYYLEHLKTFTSLDSAIHYAKDQCN